MGSLGALEGADGRLQGDLKVGPAKRNGIGIQGIGELEETGFVDGQRTKQEGIAGKGDQAEPVRRIGPDEFPHQPLSLRQPVRLHIIGQHTPGNIEKDHQVTPRSGIGQDAASPGGSGGGQDGEKDSQEKSREPEDPEGGIHVQEGGCGAGGGKESIPRPFRTGSGQKDQNQEKGYDPEKIPQGIGM